MANEKRFLVLSLKWWQKLQPKWRRGENLTLIDQQQWHFRIQPVQLCATRFISLSFIWDGREGIAKLSWIHHPITQHLKQVNNLHPEKLLLAESCGIRNFIPNRRSDVQVHGCHLITLRKCVWWWNQSDEMYFDVNCAQSDGRCDRLPRKACMTSCLLRFAFFHHKYNPHTWSGLTRCHHCTRQ